MDEQKLLEKHGKNLHKIIQDKAEENRKVFYIYVIFDDGLQDTSIDYDLIFVCFNNLNWIGNSFLIPAGPLRENVSNLRFYNHIFLNGNNENLTN